MNEQAKQNGRKKKKQMHHKFGPANFMWKINEELSLIHEGIKIPINQMSVTWI